MSMFGFGSTNPSSSPFGGGGFGTNPTFGQPPTNTFGTPSTSFGTTPSTPSFGTGFGTSTGFGQPTTTGFGATSTPSFGSTFGSTTPSTGFGTGFGTTPSTGFGQPTSPGGFGTPSTTPSTGFGATSTSTGLFGSSTTFGSQPSTGGMFGSTTPSTTGGLFGSTPSSTTSAPFGSTFGSTTPSNGFGFGSTTPSTGFGLTGTPGAPTGTGNPPYKTTPDADTGTGTTLQMISITAMQNFQGKSFEELRWEDYQLKKNSGNFSNTMSTGPAFGSTLGTTPSTGGLFGSTPTFGTQPSTTSTPSTGFGGFSTTPSTGSSLFGSTPFGSTPSTSTSTFGSTTPSTFGTSTPSTFGTSTTAPFGTSTTSTFGQPATSTTFGQPASTAPGFNFATGFGSTPTPSTSTSFSFSQPSTTGTSTTAPFSFSNAPSTTAPSSSFLSTPSTNLFGSTTTTTPNLFGSTTSTLPSFGAPSTVSTGLFNNPPSLTTPNLGFNFSSTPSTTYGSSFPSLTGAPSQPKQATITGSPFGMVSIPSLSVNGAPSSPAPTATITPTTTKVKKAAPSPHFKLTPRSAAKMKPRGFVATSALGKPTSETPMSPDIFVPRESIKKLTIDMSVSEEEPERPVKSIHHSGSSSSSTIAKDSRKFGSSTSPINLSGLNSSQVTPQSTPQNKTATTPVTEVIQKPIAKRGPIEQQALSSIKKVESPIASAEIPKLNRPGYWMSPRVEELSRLTSEQLAAVENFRVGLEDVGSVQFVGQTDVRNLDLDKIIEFSRGEIVVYPDEHAKPPIGEGLNKTAVITLHGCFPLDRATGRPKLDDDSLSRYEAKILKSTSRLGATFIKYEKRTGDWVFQVHHFSRYGLLDDTDEEEEEETTGSTTSNLQQYGSMDKFPITQPVFTTPTPNRFKIGESDSDIDDQNEHPLAEEVS